MPSEQHWADKLAATWIERRGKKHRVQIGWSPSGAMHIGFLREMILGDVLFRCLRSRGTDVRFNLFVDSLDPLRDREREGKPWYTFLPESYRAHVGKPVSRIPAPDGSGGSYADYFLAPVRGYMQSLGVRADVILSHEAYAAGLLTPQITRVLENLSLVRRIIEEVTGFDRREEWTGLNVICPGCGRIDQDRLTGWDTARKTVTYECACGREGEADYSKGDVKLSWRLDWPARWAALGVTVEPFGKDHATAGGSYDTGSRLAREIYGAEPPEPVVYEWINDKDGQPFSSSAGNVIDPGELLRSAAPEIIRYFILSKRPSKAIRFDPEDGLLALYREYETLADAYWNGASARRELSEAERRDYELSQVGDEPRPARVRIPYRNLVSLIQVSGGDPERLRGALERTGYADALDHPDELETQVGCAENWIASYAPADARMELQLELPAAARSFSPKQREFLHRLADYMEQETPDADSIHNRIYHLAREEVRLDPKDAFRAIYVAFLGRERGPRAGWFLRSLDPRFAVERLRGV